MVRSLGELREEENQTGLNNQAISSELISGGLTESQRTRVFDAARGIGIQSRQHSVCHLHESLAGDGLRKTEMGTLGHVGTELGRITILGTVRNIPLPV